MDIDKTADEAAGRVLDQIERDGAVHRSRIARVIADEMHRANRQPYMMARALPGSCVYIDDLETPLIRKHDPG
jgi:hypothetical protein